MKGGIEYDCMKYVVYAFWGVRLEGFLFKDDCNTTHKINKLAPFLYFYLLLVLMSCQM